MKPIRILHMIGSLEVGGSQAFVLNIYREIDRDLIQFDFIVDHPQRLYYKNDIESLGGKIYYMPTFTGTNICKLKKEWNIFFQEHTEYKVLHSHVRSYAALYLPIAKKHGVTTIIHSHSQSNGNGISSIIKSILQYPLRYEADYFFACSNVAGKWLFGNKIEDNNRYKILKNGINVERFKYDKCKRLETRKMLNLERDVFVLGYLGRVTVPKNPFFAIEVFSKLIKILPNAKMLFVGEGILIDSVKNLAKELKVIDNILFIGVRDDTENMYCAMDCYIFPSLWEGLGISLIEAQASGLPCICSENIPDEAIITDLVRRVGLYEGTDKWAELIADSIKNKRKSDLSLIVEAGYDVKENVKWIEKFYLSCK